MRSLAVKKSNKYPKYDAYLLEPEIKGKITEPYNIVQGQMWVRHWDYIIKK